MLEALKKRIGETGEVLDHGLAWMERQAAETADMDVPVLSKVADAVVNPALVGVRAAIANATSGGGRHYQPEVRDERYFSKAALRELGKSIKGMHGRTAGRADGMDNAAQFNLTQTIGGFTVKDGAVTDKFDINQHYHGVPDAMTSVARAVLGREEDPDAGKIKTVIPIKKLTQQAAKGGDNRFRLMGNFLATDKVPDTLFGFEIAASDEKWTDADRAFFKDHPEAGGYYDLEEAELPDEGEHAAEKAGDAKTKPEPTVTDKILGTGAKILDRSISVLDRVGILPTNGASLARDILAKHSPVPYEPVPITEDNFTPEQLKAMLHMRIESGGKGISKKGIDRALDMRKKGRGYGDSDMGLWDRIRDPASVVETTVGQAGETVGPDGRPVIVDTYDFNERSRRYYEKKAAEPDASAYVKIRNFAQHAGHTDKDPDEGKIKVRINVDRAMDKALGRERKKEEDKE